MRGIGRKQNNVISHSPAERNLRDDGGRVTLQSDDKKGVIL